MINVAAIAKITTTVMANKIKKNFTPLG